MKKLLLLSVLFIYAFTSDTKKTEESLLPQESFLFVQTAENAQIKNRTTIIIPVEKDIFGFSDRPNRKHGWLKGEQFASLWSSNEPNSFKKDPPNAVLTFTAGNNNKVQELEVVITETTFDKDKGTLIYSIQEIPADWEIYGPIINVSLFVDSFWGQFLKCSVGLFFAFEDIDMCGK